MPNAGFAVVPIVGGLTLMLGGFLALYTDRRDLCADAQEPRPILVRYTSQATYALRKTPHWIFVATQVIFAPCLIATAQWQAERARRYYEMPDLADKFTFYSVGCAIGGFLVALLPMGNVLGTIVHIVTAGIFIAFGLNYGFQAWALALETQDDDDTSTLATIRLLACIIASVGVVICMFTIKPAGTATEKIAEWKKRQIAGNTPASENHHDDDNGDDNGPSIRSLRIAEMSLAIGQISVAIGVGIVLVTGAADILEDDTTSATTTTPKDVWTWPLVALLAIMLPLVALFVYLNDWLYHQCQAEKDSESSDKQEKRDPDANKDRLVASAE